ncbi:MAG: DUF1844 domain-containing protein [Deltaproteobacteria bacterium]|jgi:hypothetical protein|nr:DUF1844 domain-containing protein [Deltaproteobacteria bacterium]
MSEIVVNDRRTFAKDGTLNPQSSSETKNEEPKAQEVPPADKPPQEDAESKDSNWNPEDLARGMSQSLTSLFVGLASTALVHMGEHGPETKNPPKKDLPAAKLYIDLLALLQKKTRGNLDPDEEAILSTFLYDLRMKYVELNKAK